MRFWKSSTNLVGHVIVIEQVPLPEDTFDKERPVYNVKIRIDGSLVDPNAPIHTFYDPISPAQYQACCKYLNEALEDYDETTDEDKFQTMSESIYKYGSDLFDQLSFGGVSDMLKFPKLNIEIKEAPRIEGTINSIHRLRWEQLEHSDLWQRNSAHPCRDVTVRRTVPQMDKKDKGYTFTLARSKPQGKQKEKGKVYVLLVIARSVKRKGQGYFEIDPAITLSTILQMKHRLQKLKDRHQIALEIVRPGTFAALKQHLESRPVGYFDIIHFDLHGKISGDSRYATSSTCTDHY